MKPDEFYQSRLAKYLDEYYSAFEDTIEFLDDPAHNAWKFRIPEINYTATIFCNDDGIVTEQKGE
jgi:hypothetical protein